MALLIIYKNHIIMVAIKQYAPKQEVIGVSRLTAAQYQENQILARINIAFMPVILRE